jgi:hypothetical protein
MGLGEQVAVYLGIFLLVWYGVASFYNRRKGVRIYRWLQPGVATTGEITAAKWIGSSGSGARISVAKANKPFRRIDAAYLLETRELLPLWIFNHLRGRRDLLVLRIDLRSVPSAALELMHAGDSRLRGMTDSDGRPVPSEQSPTLGSEFEVAWLGRVDEKQLQKLSPFIEEYGASLWRLSVSRRAPHLIFEFHVPQLLDAPSSQLFDSLAHTLGEQNSSSGK